MLKRQFSLVLIVTTMLLCLSTAPLDLHVCISAEGLHTAETWSISFSLRLPYLCLEGDYLEVIYLAPGYDPPEPHIELCVDLEKIPDVDPRLAELWTQWSTPIQDVAVEVTWTLESGLISSHFEFAHSITGHLISADLNGAVVGDTVSFTVVYHLPSELQHYSRDIEISDQMTNGDGTIYYSLPAEFEATFEGTLTENRIEGNFTANIDEQFARLEFYEEQYEWPSGELWLIGRGELRFSDLRIRGYFTVNIDRVPVLLVHGWGRGSARSWDTIKSWLEADGYHVEVLEYDNSGYIDVAARELSQKVQEMLLLSDKIDIIAHSYGGLVSRYYVETMGGSKYIRNLIMLATPNHGSQLADILTDSEDNPARPIIEFLLTIYFGSNPRTWDSTYHLRTTGNPTLENLNRGLDLSKLGTRYFVIAGTRNIVGLSSLLPGHDDGVVTVDSASLEYKGAPIYCVKLDHFQIVSTLARDMYNRIVVPILQDSVPDPLAIGCNCPESEDPDDAYIREVLEYTRLAAMLGDTVNGTFLVADEYDFLEVGIVFPSCDFNFTLVSPTGIEITPESANKTSDVDFFMLENYWYYLIRNPETGKWQYDIVIVEVPENGVDIGFISFEVIPEFPSQLILPLFMILTLLATLVYRGKHSM